MSNQFGIVHPKMLAKLRPHHFASLCTIQQATEVADTFGQLQPTWTALAGHVGLRCRVAPARVERETRSMDQTYAEHRFTIEIAGHYPTIIEKMRLVVGAKSYDIEQVQHDGNSKLTRLTCRIVA